MGCVPAFVERIFYFNIDCEIVMRHSDGELLLSVPPGKKAASTKRFCRVRLPIPLRSGVIGRALAADDACLLPVGIEVVCNAITRLATHSRVKSPIRIDNTAGRRSFATGSSGLVNDNHANG
jgi:hypothetical protein